jgi:Protein of unknown function (DUF2905)
MWTFIAILVFVGIILTLMSFMAEQHIGDMADRRTPGYALLPGDIKVERGNVRFYFPITTSIVLSVVLTFLLWLLSSL